MIFYLIGKSSSGKDSIARELIKRNLHLQLYTMYTTRPRRSHEVDGREYHFISVAELNEFEEAGKIIEKRVYNTIHGPWTYATIDDGSLCSSYSSESSEGFEEAEMAVSPKGSEEDGDSHTIMIGTLESFVRMRDRFGADFVKGLYIDTDDGVRLQRALEREMKQEEPKYKEMCRRYLADEEDFSEDKVQAARIDHRFMNHDFITCVDEIEGYIESLSINNNNLQNLAMNTNRY